jgi:putative oxidoreductase
MRIGVPDARAGGEPCRARALVVAGLLFFQHGAVKLLGWFDGAAGFGEPAPALLSQMGIGAVLELVCGLCVMLGALTRPAAFLASGEMAVAYWQFHFPRGAWPAANHGDPAVLFCFLFLFIAAQGAGRWSVDGWWSSRARARGEHDGRIAAGHA